MTDEIATFDPLNLRGLAELALPDRVIDSSAIPWIPLGDGNFTKPLRLDLVYGRWVTLFKAERGGIVARHRHVGPVTAWVLEGSWRYLDRDWVATCGKLIYEPPGDVHTLVCGDEGTVTLFQMEGALIYVDENENVIGQDDVMSFTKLYNDYCTEHGIEVLDLHY
jgi:anti-sigma factor ChrR (cupin superfamily)